MNASCDFTRREETRDHFTLTVDDLSFTIDSDPAHRVMNRHTGERSPKRSLFDLEGQIAIGLSEPENRGIYTQSDSPKKSSRNIWSLAVVSVDQRY